MTMTKHVYICKFDMSKIKRVGTSYYVKLRKGYNEPHHSPLPVFFSDWTYTIKQTESVKRNFEIRSGLQLLMNFAQFHRFSSFPFLRATWNCFEVVHVTWNFIFTLEKSKKYVYFYTRKRDNHSQKNCD